MKEIEGVSLTRSSVSGRKVLQSAHPKQKQPATQPSQTERIVYICSCATPLQGGDENSDTTETSHVQESVSCISTESTGPSIQEATRQVSTIV